MYNVYNTNQITIAIDKHAMLFLEKSIATSKNNN